MSKLITGECKIKSLAVVRDACTRLQWQYEQHDQRHGRVHVPRDTGAMYRPYIDIEIQQGGKALLTYDHVMGLGMAEASRSTDDMDTVTRTVLGQFKGMAFQVQLESLLESNGLQWEQYQRGTDQAMVLTVNR